MADPIVEVSHLRKTYGEKVAVDDVSFAVQPGEIFGILGPNGAGKTTTVETLAGLRTADRGTVRVRGIDTQRDPAAVRDILGVQLQEAALHDKITVREALTLFAGFYANPADPDDLLAMLDLTPHADRRFAKLSGGQKQRLSIALALIGNPEIAILDELTTGLDPQARRNTWELVERVRDSGVTILLVTHFMEEAERLCDRLVIIDAGNVVAEGTPRELIDGLEGGHTVVVRFAPEDVERGRRELGVLVDRDPEVEGAQQVGGSPSELAVTGTRRVLFSLVPALAAADLVPEDVRTVARSLEDVFLAHTGRAYTTESGDAGAPTDTALVTEGGRS
ncbi:ABC transporter ATP-binding protein [Isoptericola cucumis]|uniref:Multidrug ABC transporter ATP-binding protein n=1 Tax=Isoptericola cucumis TaxID=1776856 RepID=A0ABQ2B314_9MICO|nr:ABC transporter ATP-binding protein [Isoptericola cucumis]GGI05319.1 multidrug ABC transporter ATP-binding protein [Isoptericola cucumis]